MQHAVAREAVDALFARLHRDLEDLRRLPPVQQAWVKGMSRERLGTQEAGWRGEEYRVCRPNGPGVAYRRGPTRSSGEVVEEVVDISVQPCQAKQEA